MKKTTLEELVSEHLKPKTRAEWELLQKAPIGELVYCDDFDNKGYKPEESDQWSEDRNIRADLLYWLCVNQDAVNLVHAKGIRVYLAKIIGPLDFEFATLSRPLVLDNCKIEDKIILLHARTRTIILSGSHTKEISADGLVVEGDVFLQKGFRAQGEVSFLGANISGNLNCAGSSFENEEGIALYADGISTKGDVLLRNGFTACGEVRFLGANIGGGLNCSGSTFENKGGIALYADGIFTKESVFLCNGFAAHGEVRLLGANIGGNLECEGSTFENENGTALSADRLSTKGDVFLCSGFKAKGEVNLIGADIGSDLLCNGSTFENPNGDAFDGARLRVKGLFLWTGIRATGRVVLTDAKTGQLEDDKESWPKKGQLELNGFEYEALTGDKTLTGARDRLKWLAMQPARPFKPQPYEQLAKVLRAMGHETDACEVLMAKQKALRRHGELGLLSRAWNWFLENSIGYGWQPWKAILCSAIIIFLGTALFMSANIVNVMQPTKKSLFVSHGGQRADTLPAAYPGFHPFIYSLDAFVPFVDLHQENYWLPNA